MKQKSVIQDKSFDFAKRIVRLNKFLTNKNEFVLSRNVMRAGTSIGAYVEEANASQTKKVFAQKLALAYKEANETRYWLSLLKDSGLVGVKEGESMINDCDSLLKMIGSAVRTVRANLKTEAAAKQ